MATSVAAVSLLSAGCTPQTTGAKVISGTISGADGRIVDTMLGFDVLDAWGNKIDMGSIRVGYSAIQRLNHCVPVYGATRSQRCPISGDVTSYYWSLRLPSNAVRVYIEAYPKAPTLTSWLNNYRGYTGPAAGDTNLSNYSMAYKRSINVPGSVGNVSIVLPKSCSAGGTTGTLFGHIAGWPRGANGTADAWSLAPDSTPSLGFGLGSVDGNGNYRIDGLQRNQRYGIIASGPGFYRNVVNYTNSVTNNTLVPASCYQKGYNF